MEFIRKDGATGVKGDASNMQARLQVLEAELQRYEAEARKRQEVLEAASAAVGDLTFYKVLPEQEVTPEPLSPASKQDASKSSDAKPKDDVSSIIRNEMAARPDSAARPKSGNTSSGLRVQVGSYKKRSDAEDLKSQLSRLRLTGTVEETNVPELGLWYRVYLGPYASRAEAEFDKAAVQKELHITGLIVKQSKKP